MDSHIKKVKSSTNYSERGTETEQQSFIFESLNQSDDQRSSSDNALFTSSTPIRRTAPSSFTQPAAKRLRTEVKPSDDTQLRNVLLEWKREKLHCVTQSYNEHLIEMFYLDHEGNIMDMQMWLKRPAPELINYVKKHKLEGDTTLETKLLGSSSSNSSSISNFKVIEEPDTPPLTPIHKSSSLVSKPSKKFGSLGIKHRKISNSEISAGTNQQDQMVEKARQEAYIMQRIASLRKEGLWGEKRLPKIQEATRPKAHWDYLLEEMVWLSADFAQERKWKKAAAKKCAKMVQKYFQDKTMQVQRAEKEQEMKLRKIASFVAKEVRTFWSNVGKLIEFKVNARLDEKKKKALDQQLSFIVDQTEKYSSMLAESMKKPEAPNISSTQSQAPLKGSRHSDDEFQPEEPSEDDEATIAREDDNPEEQASEVQLLKKESEQTLEDVLKDLPPEYFTKRDEDDQEDETSSTGSQKEDESGVSTPADVDEGRRTPEDDVDGDFEMDESGEDDEETIQEQEEKEEGVSHETELAELQAENELSVEELRKKYEDLAATSEPFEEEIDEDGKSDVSMKSVESDDDDDVQEDDIDEEMLGLEDLIDQSFSQSDEEIAASKKRSEKADKELQDAAAVAESLQPKGFTLSSTSVTTPIPFLLKHTLREYQHVGLDWLVTMYEKKLNGILADEMGLGKTIQTIALLTHLACEKRVWGPHLIVVPTSVMLNWEMEFKKWCPAFKILTYYGSQKERKLKRQGWTKTNAFHICITSYKLVIQDHQSFRRKKWKYFILDEAQNIKNFKSQRWQLLLNFQSSRRLLLTGTPLQNSLMELWSLMHFLMPNIFASHREFREWFSNPVTGMIEGNKEYNDSIIKRLHKVLRPFILRRLKTEVEQQMPKKYEHVVVCRLSKRQRFLYEEFMSRTKTKETLASGNFLSVINILMQLRKVCNHPNLFEPRPTISPFMMNALMYNAPSLVYGITTYNPFKDVDLFSLNLLLCELEKCLTAFAAHRIRRFQAPQKLIQEIDSIPDPPPKCPAGKIKLHVRPSSQPIPRPGITPLVGGQRASAPSVVTLKPVNAPSSTSAGGGAAATGQSQTQWQSGVRFQLVPHGGSYKAIPLPPGSTGGILMQQTPQGPRLIMPQRTVQVSTSSTTTQGPPNSATSTASTAASGSVGGLQLVQTSAGQYLLTSSPVQKTTSSTSSSIGLSGNTAVALLQRLQGLKGLQGSVITTGAGGRPVLRLPTSSLRQNLPISGATTTTTPSTSSASNPKPVLQSSNSSQQVTQVASVKSTSQNCSAQSSLNSSPTASPSKAQQTKTQSTESRDADSVVNKKKDDVSNKSIFYLNDLEEERKKRRREKLQFIASLNTRRCQACPIYGADLMEAVRVLLGPVEGAALTQGSFRGQGLIHCQNAQSSGLDRCTGATGTTYNHCTGAVQYWDQTDVLNMAVNTPQSLLERLKDITDRFVFCVPAVIAATPSIRVCHPHPSLLLEEKCRETSLRTGLVAPLAPLHSIVNASVTQFPDPRLIQYDCGKLQTLDPLLRRLKTEGHRALIFTQMTKMLDVFESFLNFHGHLYLRLDGTTKVEQRQALMERFNQNNKIFVFILSTRSGGIGVNLTGADTVIFYDSDWNPTMDAQAQDRCHRIGQTRDVHIYRLISEKTIEENILKKANQKRLLGDLAIEGGNFTTASLKTQTINDLFEVDVNEQDAAKRMKEVLEKDRVQEETEKENVKMGEFENALAAAEDETDVEAAKTAKAEAAAELAEFDENIPLEEQETEEVSKAEQEVALLMKQLTPIERYAMSFLEASDEGLSAEAERLSAEIEAQKKEWEEGRMQALREEERRLLQEEEDDQDMLTYSSVDAYNQMWVSYIDNEIMPIWEPPTPPRDENDLYLDQSLSFWYDTSRSLTEAELPAVYITKENNKRIKLEPSAIAEESIESTPVVRGPQKIKREETTFAPRSLFDRRDLKKDLKLMKYRTLSRPTLGGLKPQHLIGKPSDSEPQAEWLIHEDWSIVHTIQQIQQLPLHLNVLSQGHIPNWDLVCDLVNSFSVCFRSQRQCRNRYENVLLLREENKEVSSSSENPTKKVSKKNKGLGNVIRPSLSTRGMGSFQLFQQDSNSKFSSLCTTRFDTIKDITVKKAPTMKPMHVNPSSKNSKPAQVFSEHSIQYEDPLSPPEVASKRSDRESQAKAQQQQQSRLQQHQTHSQSHIPVSQLQRQLQQAQQIAQQQQQQQQQHVAVVAAGGSTTQQQQPVVVSSSALAKVASSLVLNQGVGSNLVSAISSTATTIGTTSTTVSTTTSATILSGVRTAVANQGAGTTGRTTLTLQDLQGRTGTSQATVVSVASLSQIQAKLTASLSGQGTQQRGVAGVPVQTRTLIPQQMQYLRQAQRQTLALHSGKVVATSTTGDQQTIKRVQIAGQSGTGQKVQVAVSGSAVPGITAIQMVKPGTIVATAGTSGASGNSGKTVTRTVTESEMNALLRRQPQQIAKVGQLAQMLAKQKPLVGVKGATVGLQLGTKTGIAGSGLGTVQILQSATQKHMTVQQFQQVMKQVQQQQQQSQIIQQGTVTGTVVGKAIATCSASTGNNNGVLGQTGAQSTKLIPVTVTTQPQPIKQTIQVVSAGSSVVGAGANSNLRVPAGERASGITLQSSAMRVANPGLLSLGSAALQGQPVSVAVRTPASNSVRIQTTALGQQQSTTATATVSTQQDSSVSPQQQNQ